MIPQRRMPVCNGVFPRDFEGPHRLICRKARLDVPLEDRSGFAWGGIINGLIMTPLPPASFWGTGKRLQMAG